MPNEPRAEGGTGDPTSGNGGLVVPLGVHFDKLLDVIQRLFEDRISSAEQNLRRHIADQIAQVSLALETAEKLELQRIEAVQREAQLVAEASEKAIAKAEGATERRFESVNAFREQLTTQTASFLPREVADAQFTELRRSLNELAEKVTKLTG